MKTFSSAALGLVLFSFLLPLTIPAGAAEVAPSPVVTRPLGPIASNQCTYPGEGAYFNIVDRAHGRFHTMGRKGLDRGDYVVGSPGLAYQLVACNQTPRRMLAVVAVDGVDVLNGESATLRHDGYIVEPYAQVIIDGWRQNGRLRAPFLFADLGAVDAKPPGTGRIQVMFYDEAAALLPEATSRNERTRQMAAPLVEDGALRTCALSDPGSWHEVARFEPARFVRQTGPASKSELYYESPERLRATDDLPPESQPQPATFWNDSPADRQTTHPRVAYSDCIGVSLE